ncbi:MAG: PepSY domain-containing protein [Clostridia bacterium]|nr:PepSY domain-containing protein [Clostridia bacterium]
MKNNLKKLLSLLLAVVTVFSLSTVAFAAAPAKVTNVSTYAIDDDEISLKWNAVKNADGYSVFIYNGSKWKGYGSTKRLYMEVDDLQSAKAYKFRVRAYEVKNGKRNYGPYSAIITAVTKPDEVDDVYAAEKNKNSLVLKWAKVRNARGYQVYMYDKAKDKYVRKAVVSKNSAEVKSLSANSYYIFRVRAYYKYDGKYYYGEFSDAYKAKTAASASSGSSSKPAEVIPESKAAQIALSHAGLKKADVREFECELDYERGAKVYEVSFDYGRYDYEYEIDAVSGKILRNHKERD